MDAHIQIEITGGKEGNLSQALASMKRSDGDFPEWGAGQRWWHKAPDNARAILARRLSRYGLTGRLSVMPHEEGTAWDAAPKPCWSGFTARTNP